MNTRRGRILNKIPRDQRGRLLLAIEAAELNTSDVMIRTGYSSQRLAGYTSGTRRIMPDVAVVLGNAIGFNTMWIYHGDIEKGITSLELQDKIKQKLEAGWRTPPLHKKRGRPKGKPRFKRVH